MQSKTKTVAVIVAHPDDETLWPGGTILSHPSWRCFIVCASGRNNRNRAAKFAQVLKVLGAGVSSLEVMLSKDFIKLVFISIIIATPLSWLVMHKWLQGFAYRDNIHWCDF